MTSAAFLLFLPALAMIFLASGARWRFLVLFGAVIIFQNIATMVLLKSGIIGIQEGVLLLYIKEAILALALTFELALIIISGRISFDSTDLFCFGYLGYCLLHFLFLSSEIPLGLRVAGFRSLAILPSVYLLGRWILMRQKQGLSLQFGGFYLTASLAVAVAGIFEFLFLPESFWVAVGQPEYYLMKMGFQGEVGELYGNMYASFGTFFLRRAASLTADPIMSTYFTVYGLFIMTLARPLARLRWIVFAAGSLFTMGRSAILTYFAGIFETMLDRRSLIPFGWFSALIFFGLLCIPFLPIESETLNMYFGSHYRGLSSALESVKTSPLGTGIGSASNLVAALLAALGKEQETSAGDTYVGSLVVQIGIPGVLLFIGFNLSLAQKLFTMSKWTGGRSDSDSLSVYYKSTGAFILGVTALSTINETGYGLTAAGLAFLLGGLLTTEFYMRAARAEITRKAISI